MMRRSVVILVAGAHASGKRTAVKLLKQELQSLDRIESTDIDLRDYEGQHEYTDPQKGVRALRPSRFNFERVRKDLERKMAESGDAQKVFIVFGLYSLYDKKLRDMAQIKVYISADPDTRLVRWIKRDVLNGNLSLEDVVDTYLTKARDEMNNFIFPTKEFADVIMPRGAEINAVKLIVDGIMPYLDVRDHVDRLYGSESYKNLLRPSDRYDNRFYEMN